MMNNDELKHYGVKGMEWGVRKKHVKLEERRVPVDPRPDKLIETREMLAHDPKKRRTQFKSIFRDVREMSKIKNGNDVQEWSEKEDSKIRDDLFYGKITKDEAKRRSDLLASQTDFMFKALNGKRFVHNNPSMTLSMQQANQFAMDQATRASINASLQTASLGAFGGMNPFMFGMM